MPGRSQSSQDTARPTVFLLDRGPKVPSHFHLIFRQFKVKMTRHHEEEEERVSHVYVRSADHSWIPALQLKVLDGDRAKIARPNFKNEQEMMSCGKQQKYADNEVIDLNEYPNKTLPMQNVDANGSLEEYKDMVELPFMHEVRTCPVKGVREKRQRFTLRHLCL
jgi:hypothetical protein